MVSTIAGQGDLLHSRRGTSRRREGVQNVTRRKRQKGSEWQRAAFTGFRGIEAEASTRVDPHDARRAQYVSEVETSSGHGESSHFFFTSVRGGKLFFMGQEQEYSAAEGRRGAGPSLSLAVISDQ